MNRAIRGPGRKVRAAAAALPACALAFGWLCFAGGASAHVDEPPRFKEPSDYSSAPDWFLKAENLVPHGRNPLYYPVVPGHRHIFERPDHPDGRYRKETVVLDELEPFDIPGIGKFNAAVVQEEEYMDGVLQQRSVNWTVIDKTTNNVYSVGEVSWEIDEGKPTFVGTWRAGEPDGNGLAEPGMLMPGTFMLGARYIFDGSESESFGGSENLEARMTFTVPAGTFENCVRVREQSLEPPYTDITDKVYCPGVGIVSDTSDGKLVASAALPAGHPGSDVSSFGHFLRNPLPYTPPVAKVTTDQAQAIALRTVPGRVTSVKIERKRGKNVFTVEILSPERGERDVFVDIESGEVVGTD